MARKSTKIPEVTNISDLPEEAFVPEAEQPFPIPKHWNWVKLGAVINLISGRDSKLSACNSDGRGIPYVMGASNFTGSSLTIERWIEVPEVESSAGDILITVKGTIGKLYLQAEERLNLSRQVMAVRPGALTETNFLYLFLEAISERLAGQGVGLIPGISRALLLQHPLPLPPLEEQRQIVNRLKSVFNKIDAVQVRLDTYLGNSEERRERIIQAGVTGALTEHWREKNTAPEWTHSTLGKILRWASGGTPSRKNPAYYTGSIPWVKTGELDGSIIFDTEEHITEEAISQSSAKLFPKGSVLIAMYGATIGKCGILGVDAATNQACACAFPSDEVNSEFLYYYLTGAKSDFISLAKGGAQPNISQAIIKNFPFHKPSRAEQDEIVRHIKSLLMRMTDAEVHVQDASASLEELKDNALFAALSGQRDAPATT